MPDLDSALDDDIGDELLRLIFTACHPRLSHEARAALTLGDKPEEYRGYGASTSAGGNGAIVLAHGEQLAVLQHARGHLLRGRHSDPTDEREVYSVEKEFQLRNIRP